MKRSARFLLAAVLLIASSAPRSAALGRADPSSIAADPAKIQRCRNEIVQALSQQHRIYRDILFGRKKAADETEGNTRHTEDGTAWIKIHGRWVSAGLSPGKTLTDEDIDTQTEGEWMNEFALPPEHPRSPHGPRLGLFEAKGKTTSQIVPGLGSAYRAFQCRLAAVCATVSASNASDARSFTMRDGSALTADDDKVIVVSSPNCLPMQADPFPDCRFANTERIAPNAAMSSDGVLNPLINNIVRDDCEPAREELLQREQEYAKMLIAYDASYRSLLQFSGNFDSFLFAFHGDILDPLDQALALIGNLTRVPCFLSACTSLPHP